jgi:general secretion pathway protein F
MRFQYQAVHDDGRVVTGLIEAASERSAHRDLLRRGVRPTALTIAAAPQTGFALPLQRAVRPRDYSLVLKQLSTLVKGGVPIADAAATLAEATEQPALAAAYAALNAALRRGEAFPPAFAQTFPGLAEHVHRMIAAGDMSGRLAEALADAAAETEHAARVRAELRQAVVYPTFLVGFGCLAMLFIFLVVVPRFAAIFHGKLDRLPFLSYLVITFGMWLRAHLIAASALVGAAGITAFYGLRRPRLRATALDLAARLPLLAAWLHDAELARWASVLARLLENRVPLIQGLELARGMVHGRRRHALLAQVERDVRGGTTLAAALQRSAFLAGPALSLVQVGERSGNLADMVRSIATMYEDRVRDRTRMMLAIIEPVAIVLIGGMIGLVATAIFLAITSINRIPGL